MKIIHTSDWHLGSKLYEFDRTEELFAQVDKVCSKVEEHNAKVLLVAGDIFERMQRPRLHEVTKRLAEKLKPLIAKGRHVILVPGNHDFRDHFRLMKSLLDLEKGESERVHIIESFDELEIDGIQFSIIPYPERELLEGYSEYIKTPDKVEKSERNQSLSAKLADFVRDVTARLDPKKPSVFVTHIQVEGVTTPNEEKELTYREDITLGKQTLSQINVDYIALGHIHQCQKIDIPTPCWYSGSFDRMNLGERNDEKKVLLVDIEENGLVEVTPLDIEATPFDEINVASDELESFAESYPNCESTYVRINIECKPGDNIYELKRRAKKKFFPKCLSVQCTGEHLKIFTANNPVNAKDYKKTVDDWLDEQFKDETEEERNELKKRASNLMKEVENALTAN